MLVGFEEASYFVGEPEGFLTYHLRIWGFLEREVTVDIATNNGYALRKLKGCNGIVQRRTAYRDHIRLIIRLRNNY